MGDVEQRAISVRLPSSLLGWVDGYARERRVGRSAVIRKALEDFAHDALTGVPELGLEPSSAAPEKVVPRAPEPSRSAASAAPRPVAGAAPVYESQFEKWKAKRAAELREENRRRGTE